MRSRLNVRGRVINLDRYAGEWLVLTGSRVVAHSRSLSQAMLRASKKKLRTSPSVFLVPQKDEGPYLLFV